jgi:LacI family transcriptional regulator
VTHRDFPKERSRATIDDVALKAGVSTATVSRVINNTGTVAPRTREIVLDAISELNYRPQSAAQILASKKTSTIGLLFQAISGEFFSPMLRGIESGAQESGYNLLIYSTQLDPSDNSRLAMPLGEHNTDGVLIFVDSIIDEEIIRFSEIGFPVVLIHQSPPNDLQIPWITVENKSGARKMMNHLIEVHQYRRIAFLSGSVGHEDSHWRELGYRESLAAHDIPFDPELIASGNFNRDVAQTVVKRWLQNGTQFDAIFAADDEMALGVIAAFEKENIQIPEDIALVGFDDIYLARFLSPPLTTVKAPTEQVGKEAIRLLVDKINGRPTESIILLPTEIVVRQSCGCPSIVESN